MIHNLNNFVNNFLGNFFVLPVRISPKENSGANGKFLPKPLLFHLRHPNSKTNEPKFWQILSPKNSFAKTSSALFRHLPEYLEGRTPKKNVLSTFKRNFTPAKSRKQGVFFFRGCRGSARQWRNDTSVRGSFKPPRTRGVRLVTFVGIAFKIVSNFV